MKPIEYNGVLGRTQDISPLKQQTDAKPMVEQQNIFQEAEKTIEKKSDQVYQKDDAEMGEQYDASKQGKNQYQQDRDKKKKKEKDGKVVLKNRATFDVKI